MSKEEMIEEIKKMTVVELADLVKSIEDEFGVSAVAAAAKGQYIRSVSVSTTMGPGLYINQK